MLRCNNKVNITATQYSNYASTEYNSTRSNEESCSSCCNQNLFGIWYHDGDLSEDIRSEMRKRLNTSFTYVRIFNDLIEFIAYLTSPLVVTKIFFIITGKNAQYLSTVAKNRRQHEKVYQFQPISSLTHQPTVFTDINQLFMKISEDIEACLNNNECFSTTEPSSIGCRESVLPPPWSVWNSKRTENSFRYCEKESPDFFLFQALTRILTRMTCDPVRSLEEMIAECRIFYINDQKEISKIDMVANNYNANEAIRYYTQDLFLFRSVGRAFRSEDFEHIFIFRRYIIDLHYELDKVIKDQLTSRIGIRPLYRGKKLQNTILQQLQDNRGGLISMNGFLSTTYNRGTALKVFAGVGQNRPDYESVLFEFNFDQTGITRTYADISSISQYPQEEEVLFTIGSIWKIDSVEKIDELFWSVKLIACSDTHIRIIQFFEELHDNSTLLMIGDVLRELGQQTKAEKFYNRMLDEQTIDNETRVILYYNIAMINIDQGKDSVALENLHKAEMLIPSRVINAEPLIPKPLYSYSISPSRIHILNNMALLYQKKGDSNQALEYFLQALNVENSDRIDKATVNDNIGLIYYSGGDYQNAVKYLLEAVKLAQDHSSLAKFKQHYDAVNKHLLSKKTSITKELHD